MKNIKKDSMKVGDYVYIRNKLELNHIYGGLMCKSEHFLNQGYVCKIKKISSNNTYYLEYVEKNGKNELKYTYSKDMLIKLPDINSVVLFEGKRNIIYGYTNLDVCFINGTSISVYYFIEGFKILGIVSNICTINNTLSINNNPKIEKENENQLQRKSSSFRRTNDRTGSTVRCRRDKIAIRIGSLSYKARSASKKG